MTDVLRFDAEVDAERLQRTEDPLVVLGDRREPGAQRRELPGQPHTLPEAASELIRRVVQHCGSTRADHAVPLPAV